MSRSSPASIERLAWWVLVSPFVLGACGSTPETKPGEELEPCEAAGAACTPETDSRGSRARFCALTADAGGGTSRYCLNVCNHPADFPAGSEGIGQPCEYDVDCVAGTTCDNDVVGGTATCKCLEAAVCKTNLAIGTLASPFPPEVVVDEPEAWSHVGVCRYQNGDCEVRSVPITIVQDAYDLTRFLWGYAFDCGGPCPWNFEGRLCASDAAWSGPAPLGGFETGAWHFGTEDRFDSTSTITDSVGGKVIAKCLLAAMRLSHGEAEAPVDCLHYHPFDCVPDYDLSGTFHQRVKCSEDQGGTQVCVDDGSEDDSITFTAAAEAGAYTFGDPAGFSGHGRLCANVFDWEAEDVVYGYTEHGSYVFADGDSFAADVHHASSYRYTASGIEGHCTSTGTRDGAPPDPDTVGACL